MLDKSAAKLDLMDRYVHTRFLLFLSSPKLYM